MIDGITESEFVSIPEAAKRLGLSRKRVFEFVKDGRLSAQQAGGFYIVRVSDVEILKNQERKSGRPASANPSKVALAKRAQREREKGRAPKVKNGFK
jgi:excisionase family DNA binding protein